MGGRGTFCSMAGGTQTWLTVAGDGTNGLGYAEERRSEER